MTSKTVREGGLHLHQRLPRDKQQGGLLVSVATHQSPAGGYKYRPREQAIIPGPWRDSKVSVLPACIKRPADSNLALAPLLRLCESVVHNAPQQQDRGNYHNQRKGSSISGEPRGVNEAERGRRRERWVSAWAGEARRRGGGRPTHLCLLVPPKKLRGSRKIATRIINHGEKIDLSVPSLPLPSLSPLCSHAARLLFCFPNLPPTIMSSFSFIWLICFHFQTLMCAKVDHNHIIIIIKPNTGALSVPAFMRAP